MCTWMSALPGWSAGQPAVTNAANGATPKIEFATPTYEFGTVTAGTKVMHDFVFTNTGNATLTITSVNPGCGCTTIHDWTHTVEPGQTGVIPIQFDSTHFHGTVNKTPSITCNDPAHAVVVLQLHGSIFQAVEVSPPYVSLNLGPDSDGVASSVIHITNHDTEPITVSEPESSASTITVELITNVPGKSFDLLIKTVPPGDRTNRQAFITAKTTSKSMPQVSVMALEIVQQLLFPTPPQITLPSGSLASNQTFIVSFRNQSSRPVALAEASVNVPGATAEIRTLEPGRIFSASVNFPSGIEVPTNEPLFLTIKTDRPSYPEVRIPIVQMPHPPAAAQISPPVRITQ